MSDKLLEIMAHKQREIAPLLREVSLGELRELDAALPRPPSFAEALRRPDGSLAVIAEIKRRSPSAGAIAENASAPEQARRYHAAGASALSVLTDNKYFGGNLGDLRDVVETLRQAERNGDDLAATSTRALAASSAQARSAKAAQRTSPPCLRKDFMLHPIQVREAREAGASAILIIVRALDDSSIATLYSAARAAGLDALFEIHEEAELDRALAHGAEIIGVNNRDLAVFKTDLAFSERLIPRFPKNVIAVSESGIATATDAARARAAGAHAILVGESLMRANDPRALLQSLANA